MSKLNRKLLESNFKFPEDLKVQKFPENLPERVIQFGEGNFLRAFVDWMFHLLNKNKLFNGRVVLVQPIAEGLANMINEHTPTKINIEARITVRSPSLTML